jgi:hypothetical protein
MTSLRERLDLDGPVPRLRGAVPIELADVLRAIEAGATPEAISLDPIDWLAAVAHLGLGRDGEPGPALVHEPPRHPALKESLGETALARAFPRSSRPARLALAAGLLQIHDFWDASHQAAQLADDLGESSYSAYWHGIAHRREPDPGNAAYWFRRVGRHPLFTPLAVAARPLLLEHGDGGLLDRLLGSGAWNPGAMIDVCSAALPGTPEERVARRLQRLEMEMLLDAAARPVA